MSKSKYSPEFRAMVAVAQSQIGNMGGEAYWRWYGFESRVDWCAIGGRTIMGYGAAL